MCNCKKEKCTCGPIINISGAGRDGLSAYELAIKAGETSAETVEEWLEELKGPKGDPFVYENFTPEQLEGLKVKGDPGPAGQDAEIIILEGDKVFIYRNNLVDKVAVSVKAVEFKFTSDPALRVWEFLNINGAWESVRDGSITENAQLFTLKHDSEMWQGRESLVLRYRVGDIFAQASFIKIYSGNNSLVVLVNSDKGDLFYPDNINTVLRPEVYSGSTNITNTIPEQSFNWVRISEDAVADNEWNTEKGRAKKAVAITSSDLARKAVFECVVNTEVSTPSGPVLTEIRGQKTLTVLFEGQTIIVTPPNIVVPASSTGTVLSLANAKSKIEVMNSKGAKFTVTITSISVQGCTATFSGDTVSITGVSADSASVTANFTTTAGFSTSVRIPVEKLRNGSDGSNGTDGKNVVYLALTNQHSSVPASNTGVVQGTIPGSIATVYLGTAVDTGWAFTGTFTGCAGTVNSSTGVIAVTAMSSNTASVVITAKKAGNSDLYATYTLSKILAATPGADAVIFYLVPSVTSVKVSDTGVVSPTTVTCAKMKRVGANEATVTTELTLKYSKNGGAETNYTGPITVVSSDTIIRFFLYSGSVLVDLESIPVLTDGKNGTPGTPGAPGAPGTPGADGSGYEFQYKVNNVTEGAPSITDNTGWVTQIPTVASNQSLWMRIRSKVGSVVEGWQGPIRLTGEPGVGKQGPSLAYRGDWDPLKTYDGNSLVVDVVKYKVNGLGYMAKSTAGQIPVGTLPTNTQFWTEFSTNIDSLFTDILFAYSGTIQDLTVSSIRTGVPPARVGNSTVDGARTTIGYMPSPSECQQDGMIFDPTHDPLVFNKHGERTYYPSGRIQSYRGSVKNFAYKETSTISGEQVIEDKLSNGYATIVWEDKDNYPLHYLQDSLNVGRFVIAETVSYTPTNLILVSSNTGSTPPFSAILDLSSFASTLPKNTRLDSGQNFAARTITHINRSYVATISAFIRTTSGKTTKTEYVTNTEHNSPKISGWFLTGSHDMGTASSGGYQYTNSRFTITKIVDGLIVGTEDVTGFIRAQVLYPIERETYFEAESIRVNHILTIGGTPVQGTFISSDVTPNSMYTTPTILTDPLYYEIHAGSPI